MDCDILKGNEVLHILKEQFSLCSSSKLYKFVLLLAILYFNHSKLSPKSKIDCFLIQV